MTILQGKGMFIWKIKAAEDGNPREIAKLAKQAGLTHVLIKILDHKFPYNLRQDGNLWIDDLVGPLVDALHYENIEAWGWQWVYLTEPENEAFAAIERIRKFSLDGFIINAEAPCKGKPVQARTYARILQSQKTVPVGLSSYRYPSLHRQLPWPEFLSVCDVIMPQVYWEGASNSGWQLRRSIDDYRRFTDLPIIPTGAAYQRGAWMARGAEVDDFMRTAKSLGLTAFNFWEWSHARKLGLWEIIKLFPFAETPPPIVDPPSSVQVTAAEYIRQVIYPWMVSEGFKGSPPNIV